MGFLPYIGVALLVVFAAYIRARSIDRRLSK